MGRACSSMKPPVPGMAWVCDFFSVALPEKGQTSPSDVLGTISHAPLTKKLFLQSRPGQSMFKPTPAGDFSIKQKSNCEVKILTKENHNMW